MLKKNRKPFRISVVLSISLFLTSTVSVPVIAQAQTHAQENSETISATISTASLFPNAIYKEFEEEQVTRGVVHTNFEVFDSLGWLKGDILTVDLDDSNVGVDLLYPGNVSATATPEKMAKDAGAIAAVNGDFFDIGKTNVPIGAMIQDGEILKSSRLRGQAIGITNDRIGSIFHFILSGIVSNTTSQEAARLVLGGINEHSIEPNKLFMYTSDWGSRSRASLVSGQPLYAEVVVKNDTVVEVLENKLYTTNALEEDMYVLLGVGGAAQVVLETYQPGDVLDISMDTNVDPSELDLALGGDVHLVIDGQAQTFPTNPYRHPRTAMGFSKDGKTMYLAVVDGRQKDSRGMSYDEIAQFMASLGAWGAINLDSGGSTQMLSRPLGETEIGLVNSPSDGRQRYIPNAVGLFSNAPAGRPLGFKVESITNRIFTGLSRSFNVSGAYDEFYNPISVEGAVNWSATPSVGWFEQGGVIRGGAQKGSGDIAVSGSGAESTYPVLVLGTPAKIFTDSSELSIQKGASKSFRVFGLSDDDYHALIESRDVKLTYDNTLVDVVPQGDHSFKVVSKMDNGTALIEVEAGGLKTWVGVASGYVTVPVTEFEMHGAWTFDKYPEEVTGAVSPVLNPTVNGMALRLDYNFARTDVTRAAYMVPTAGPLALPNGTQKLGLQVYGNAGNGHWLRGIVKDSAGNSYTVDFSKNVSWEGWQYVEASIPSEVKYPIELEKIYLVSTDPNNLTVGCIVIDDLIAKIPNEPELPDEMMDRDIVIDEPTSEFNQGLKFAVLSGLEMDSGNPDTDKLNEVKSSLENAQRHGVDMVFAAGDTVARDTENNYIMADQFLNQAVSSASLHVIPGKKDIAGTGSLSRFNQTFGDGFKVMDVQGTRFLLLNMATGSWRTSNSGQWSRVIKALEEANSSPSIKNVVVMNSLPIANGVTLKTSSGASDAKEAELLRNILVDFREESGKPVAFVSGQDELTVDRLDGISYIRVGTDCPVFSINPDAENWIQILGQGDGSSVPAQ